MTMLFDNIASPSLGWVPGRGAFEASGPNPASRQQVRRDDTFLSLDTLRDEIALIRVLHDAVTLSKITDMRPILPLPRSTPSEHRAKIDHAAQTPLAQEREFTRKPAPP